MSVPVIIDIVVISCLIATIIFAIRLNKRLSRIYKSRDELQEFLNQFTTSMQKADLSIKDLKGIGESVFKSAQGQMEQASVLKDDLAFLNERGNEIADKLDHTVREAKGLQKQLLESIAELGGAKPSVATASSPANADAGGNNYDLVKTLQNVR